MPKITPLAPEKLRWVCDPEIFPFETTKDIAPLDAIIGQERALKAIEFSLGIANHGYNVYVLGESGTGRTTSVKTLLETKAKDEPVPPDWCYTHNFADPDRPKTLKLPAGKGVELREDMDTLIGTFIREIPRLFESKEYESHRDEIIDGQQELTKAIFHRLDQMAHQKGFILKKSASGLSVMPAKDGKVIGQDDFDKLPSDKRTEMDHASKFLQDRLSDAIREARKIEKDTKDRIEALDREVVQYAVTPLVNELFEKYKDFEAVVQYLSEIKEDIFRNIDDFRAKEEVTLPFAGIRFPRSEPSFERYKVNLIVSNRDTLGAPVVMETNPTYYNLFGRIEHKVQMGVAVTDFTMIKAGSIHRANGGYLVLNALDVLRNLFVYDALKRMIKNREVKIEDVWEQYRLLSTTALKPDPIPVNIKIVLIGEPYIYYLLYNMDDEYSKLFKVKADFDYQMERTEENISKYACFVSARCKEEGLLPFDRTAVAKVVEYGLRLTSDTEKLSARFNDIENLVVEASYWAVVVIGLLVMDIHVVNAVREGVYRDSMLAD
ncbi:MAG: AAA family ATPase [Deltaproteobacteria bacterium]|nr:AAA family ATPase [Deltaproteobacteria bacterium]